MEYYSDKDSAGFEDVDNKSLNCSQNELYCRFFVLFNWISSHFRHICFFIVGFVIIGQRNLFWNQGSTKTWISACHQSGKQVSNFACTSQLPTCFKIIHRRVNWWKIKKLRRTSHRAKSGLFVDWNFVFKADFYHVLGNQTVGRHMVVFA